MYSVLTVEDRSNGPDRPCNTVADYCYYQDDTLFLVSTYVVPKSTFLYIQARSQAIQLASNGKTQRSCRLSRLGRRLALVCWPKRSDLVSIRKLLSCRLCATDGEDIHQ